MDERDTPHHRRLEMQETLRREQAAREQEPSVTEPGTIAYYENGQFSDGPDPLAGAADWQGEPPGWTVTDRIGMESGYCLEIWSRDTRNPGDPAYLVVINDPNTWEKIGVKTLRDVWDLLARWSPVITATLLSDVHEELFGPDRDMGMMGYVVQLLGRLRADEREGRVGIAAREITERRREQHRQWLKRRAARQAAAGQDQETGT